MRLLLKNVFFILNYEKWPLNLEAKNKMWVIDYLCAIKLKTNSFIKYARDWHLIEKLRLFSLKELRIRILFLNYGWYNIESKVGYSVLF